MMLQKFYLNFNSDKNQKLLAFNIFFLYIIFGIFFYMHEFSLLKSLFLFLIIHRISIIPLQKILYKKNRWFRDEPFGSYRNLNIYHPQMFKLFSLGIVYPYIFVFLLLVLRYNNLGKCLTVNLSFELLLLIIGVIVFLLAWFHIVIIFINIFLEIKNFYWEQTSNFFYVIYLFLLQKNWFFLFMKKMHVIQFYFREIIDLESSIYKTYDYSKDFSYFRKFLYFLSENKIIFPYILFIIFFLEILILHQIFYFYYFLYIYFILYLVWSIFFCLRNSLISCNCCVSDCIYKNFSNPRYLYNFIHYAESPDIFLGFPLKLDNSDILHMKRISEKIEKDRKEKKYFCHSRAHHMRAQRLFKKIITKKYPLYFKLAASYYYCFYERP